MRKEERTYVWDCNKRKRENAMNEKENACYRSYNVNRNGKERERESYEGRNAYERNY